MSSILYEKRCRCKEEFLIKKRRKVNNRSEGKPLQYPDSNETKSKVFQIKYEKKLSSKALFLLNSFQKKYLYYAIDDVLYLFRSNLIERENLLNILYSAVISVHNNFSINFFEIWIQEIYVNQVSKSNKFLKPNSNNYESFNYITLKLLYRPKISIKKQKSLW